MRIRDEMIRCCLLRRRRRRWALPMVAATMIAATLIPVTVAALPSHPHAWSGKLGGSSQDEGSAIALDPSGNTIVAGVFSSTADLDPGTLTQNHTTQGGLDVFVVKLGVSGDLVWARTIGGAGDETVRSVTADNTGAVIVTGTFTGTADFDPGEQTQQLTSLAGADGYILGLTSTGDFSWVAQVKGSGADEGRSVVTDVGGSVYVVGRLSTGGSIDATIGASALDAGGYLAKFDSAGSLEWAVGAGSGTEPTAVTLDGTGRVVVGGSFFISTDLDPNPVGSFPLIPDQVPNGFVSVFTAAGSFAGGAHLGRASQSSVLSVAGDGAGGVFVGGDFSGAGDFDPDPDGDASLEPQSGAFLLRLDSDLTLQWVQHVGAATGTTSLASGEPGIVNRVDRESLHTFDETGSTLRSSVLNGWATAVAFAPDGSLAIAGSFEATQDLDPDLVDEALVTAAGGTDAFVLKLGPGGTLSPGEPDLVHTGGLSGSGHVSISSSATDPYGGLVIAGGFEGLIDFDPGAGVHTLDRPAGAGFVSRRHGGGQFHWVGVLDGESVAVYDVAVDGVGNIYLTGWFWQTADLDPGPAIMELDAADQSAFVIKLKPDGGLAWVRVVGGGSQAIGRHIAVDASGGVFISGDHAGSNDFDPGPGTAILHAGGALKGFVLKLDAAGNYSWVRNLGAVNVTAMTLTPSPGVALAGNFEGTVDFNPGSAVFNLAATSWGHEFLLELDSGGAFRWARAFGSTNPSDGAEVTHLEVDPWGNLFTAGFFGDTIDIRPGSGVVEITPLIVGLWLSKLTPDGELTWVKQWDVGNGGMDTLGGMAIDPIGGIHLTGYFTNAPQVWDWDPGPGVANLDPRTVPGAFLIRLDKSGSFLWAGTWDGGGNDAVTDPIGGVYVLGANHIPPDDVDPDEVDTEYITTDRGYETRLDLRLPVIRYAGGNRYASAVVVSAAERPTPGEVARVYLAVGTNFPDALAGAAVAGLQGAPLLLVAGSHIPAELALELRRLSPTELVILGGYSAITESVEADLMSYADTVTRISGANRYETAVELSEQAFPSGAPAVVIATGTGFADALAGGPVAAKLGGPVLLSPPGSLPQAVSDEIARLDPGLIVVVGGTAAISDGVFDELQALVGNTLRVAGPDRYRTSVALAQFGFPDGAPATFLATGANFPDALAGAAAAGTRGYPVLLVTRDSLPASMPTELARLEVQRVYVVGGINAVGLAVTTELLELLA